MNTHTAWQGQARSAEEVVALIGNGQRVFVHGAAATPTPLLDALSARRDVEGVQLYHLHLEGDLAFTEPDRPKAVFSNSLFVGPALRRSVHAGHADFIPSFLSDMPRLFASGRIPLDVALVQLSPPDAHGNCTLGTSVDTAMAAVESANVVLAEINEQMPRTHGHTVVPLSWVKAFTVTDRPIHESPPPVLTDVELAIGEHVASLVEDGATLQMGIGAIPDAALACLGNKYDLGVHTEMFSDGLLPLIESGVITNRKKGVHADRTVTSFVAGSRRLYDYVNDNQLVEFHPCDRTNDTALISLNPKVCALNAALEVDLTGQVCADSMGPQIFSGIGGQMDFVRGAALSPGGKAIIALPSTAKHGQVSRITSMLKPGAGVVTTRGHIQYVTTEFGVANLTGLNLRQRAEALISIAHPGFRAELTREVNNLRHFSLT